MISTTKKPQSKFMNRQSWGYPWDHF